MIDCWQRLPRFATIQKTPWVLAVTASESENVRDARPHDARSRVITAEELDQRRAVEPAPVREIGGRKKGLDPTRYYDWEKDGRCVDF